MVLAGRQTSSNNNRTFRVIFLDFADLLAALCRSDVCDATGVDDYYIGSARMISGRKSKVFKNLANLLAFVLVDFATESMDGKCLHKPAIITKALNRIQVFLL